MELLSWVHLYSIQTAEAFLFSFPSTGLRHFLSSSPLPQLLPFIIQNLPEALRLEGEILGQLLRAPNYKTKRRLVVAKFPVPGCTPLHFRKKMSCWVALLQTQFLPAVISLSQILMTPERMEQVHRKPPRDSNTQTPPESGCQRKTLKKWVTRQTKVKLWASKLLCTRQAKGTV